MVEIVFIFCLVSSPSVCQEERPVTDGMTLAGCMMKAELIAVDWLADHPKWMLSRWRCESGVARQIPS